MRIVPHCSRSLFRVALMSLMLAICGAPTQAGDSQQVLARQLREAPQASVRVSAALRLGKYTTRSSRQALELALVDREAGVRAAAAASLQRIGDQRALAALEPLLEDESAAVRRQARSAIESLRRSHPSDQVTVALGDMHNSSKVRSKVFGPIIGAMARKTLERQPGVRVGAAASDPAPELLLEGQLLRLETHFDTEGLRVSAAVEFVITKLPDRLLRGRVSGAATVHAERAQSGAAAQLRQLRREAVEGAARSALSQARAAWRPAADE
jgi:HEAT repeat protein